MDSLINYTRTQDVTSCHRYYFLSFYLLFNIFISIIFLTKLQYEFCKEWNLYVCVQLLFGQNSFSRRKWTSMEYFIRQYIHPSVIIVSVFFSKPLHLISCIKISKKIKKALSIRLLINQAINSLVWGCSGKRTKSRELYRR